MIDKNSINLLVGWNSNLSEIMAPRPWKRRTMTMKYIWAIGALHIALNVIVAKPEVHDNLHVASY